MSVNVNQLINKINFIHTARYVKDDLRIVDEYPAIPENQQQEQEAIKNLLFLFLKRSFPGCRIRVNTHSIMLRLDGQIHRKANKLREVFENNHEWRTWFENNHRDTYMTYRRNQHSFTRNGYVEAQTKDGKKFIYIPFKPNRINGYTDHGIKQMFHWIQQELQHDVALSTIYEDAIRLMEEETARREQERREKYERELREYTQALEANIFKPISDLEESENPADHILARELRIWARENNKAPVYAVPLTYDKVIPIGTKVKLVAPPGELEKGWHAIPTFEGYEIKEGFELKGGWGKVTKFDIEGDRSRGGVAPVVVQDHIYTQFDLDYWKHLIPERHAELFAITQQIREQFAAEFDDAAANAEREKAEQAEIAEQQRLQREREEAELRERQERERREEEARLLALQEAERARAEREQQEERQREAERAERDEQERKEREERQARLREQLRQQVATQAQERLNQTVHREEEADAAEADDAPAQAAERRPGIYRRAVEQGHVYVLFTGTEERTYIRRGNAVNAYVNAFDAQPTAIYSDTQPMIEVEDIE